MKLGPVLVALAGGAVVLAACGPSGCPTETAAVRTDATVSCGSNVAQQVTITVPLCSDCTRSAPTCSPDTSAAGQGHVFLDTKFEVCTDDSSCPTQGQTACEQVSCTVSLAPGRYTVTVPTSGGSGSFVLDTSGATPSCGTIQGGI